MARNYREESPNAVDLSFEREIRTFYELNEVMPFSSFVSLYYLCEQKVNLRIHCEFYHVRKCGKFYQPHGQTSLNAIPVFIT